VTKQTTPAELLPPSAARYLPTELRAALHRGASSTTIAEALVHTTAVRYAVGTYLPRRLAHYQLADDAHTPWLHWFSGSLLFADVSGSTALAERLSALGREGTELVTGFLNDFLAAMIAVVEGHGGDLLYFGGDALLVLFQGEGHALVAAQAAMALQQAVRGFTRELPNIGLVSLRMRIGVESGQLALASVGDAEALRYLVLGAPVNGVAVAEARAQGGEVVLGPGAWAAAVRLHGQPVDDDYHRLSAVGSSIVAKPLPPPPPPDYNAPLTTIAAQVRDLDRLTPYLPPSLLARIIADPLRPLIEADLRPVTVVFIQVVGLGALAQQLPASEAARVLQTYIGAVQLVLRGFGGVINKLDVAEHGDKILALFGAPLAYEDHAERAVRAALALQEALQQVNAQIVEIVRGVASQQQPTAILLQRIGVNTGTVFAGNVGSDERKEYTVMGDAVNTAARILAHAHWGEAWLSPTTADAVAGRFRSTSLGPFALKGKSGATTLYRLDGEAQPVLIDDAPRGSLIGRAAELAQLVGRLEQACAGRGGALRLVGEAGVGKSHLVAALVQQAARLGAQSTTAPNFSYTANIPYTPWAEWLKQRCGIAPSDPAPQRAAKLSARLAELGPEAPEWLPLLADLVRLDVPENRLTRALDAQLRQERRFELLQRLILRAADEAPLLIVVEDMHWADTISLELWREIAAAATNAPLLLLGVHRPGLPIDEASLPDDVVQLDELSQTESYALLEARCGGSLPPEVGAQLIARAMGNPFYLEELLRALLERGLLAERNGNYTLTGNWERIELPDSLNGLLLARIDRLDEGWRNLLRVASVIGQRFPFDVLSNISNTAHQPLLRSLTGLTEHALIEAERLLPERVDVFRHALIHEVAYQSLLYARRRELHRRIGEYLERAHADALDDYYGLLAHHYRLSGERPKAVQYLLKAGDAARAIFANEDALQHYRWALDMLPPDDPQAWQARDALADVLAVTGRYSEALLAYDALLAPGANLPLSQRVEVQRKRGSVLEKQGRYAEALTELRAVERIVRQAPQAVAPLALPMLLADLATVLIRVGDYDEAIAACERGLGSIVRVSAGRDDELVEAQLHATVGTIHGMRGSYDTARHHFERSLAARATADDLAGLVVCHNNLGYLAQLQSDYPGAMQHYQVAEQHGRTLGMRYALYFASANAAYAAYCLGRYPEAETRAREALALCEQMHNRNGEALVLDTLGFIHYSRGDYQAARDAFERSLALHRSLGSSYQEGNTLAAGLALVANATGNPTQGLALAREALQRGEELGAQQLQLEALNASAEALLLLGQPHEAWQAAETAVRLARALGNRSDRAVALRLLGVAAAQLGEPADQFFAWSERLADQVGNPFQRARTQAAYGALLHRQGRLAPAAAYLKAAHATFLQLGSHAELAGVVALADL
jgi:adenylate cyclase